MIKFQRRNSRLELRKVKATRLAGLDSERNGTIESEEKSGPSRSADEESHW